MTYIIDLVVQVQIAGQVVKSRYGPCREVIGGQLFGNCGDLVLKKGMNYALGWMELLQLVAGVYDPEALKRVAPNANHDLFTFPMAYGPRIAYQMSTVISALQQDPDTRQAVVFVGKPDDGPTSNLPCTETIQFLARRGSLYTVVNMRSWDLCRGLPYDWMMFTGLTMIVAKCLDLEPGMVVVHAGSAHIYDDQSTRAPEWHETRWKFNRSFKSWNDAVVWAAGEMELLQRGGTPNGIELFTPDR